MPFHTDTDIIPGESLGGITLGDPFTHYWDDITHYQETSGNLHYWMDGHNSIVYELVDCFIEFRVHMPSCRIDRIAALPGYQGAFQNIIHIGMPTTQVENLGLGFYYNELGECFVSRNILTCIRARPRRPPAVRIPLPRSRIYHGSSHPGSRALAPNFDEA